MALFGGASERLAFILQLDADGAIKGFQQVGRTAERELGKADNRLDRLGGRMQIVGAGMVAAAGVAGAAMLGMARDASELEQAVGGTEAVFGEFAGVIEDAAGRAAEAAGLSDSAFRVATTSIGGNLKRMGVEVGEAADRSIELTQVAADLAATYGGTTAVAVAALGAAFRGEADPAERFNLNLKISEQNAKAVELGLATTTSSVSEYARAQALLALITEQSADAQGQFAREADTAAGRSQIAAAQMENMRAALGQTAATIQAEVLGAVGGLAQRFNEMEPATQSLVGSVLALGTAGIGAAGALSFAAGSLLKIREASRNAEGGMTAFGRAAKLSGVAASLGAVAFLIHQIDENAKELARTFGDDVRSKLEDTDGGFEDFTEDLRQVGLGIERLNQDLSNSRAPWDADFRAQLRAGIGELENLRTEYHALKTEVVALSEAEGISLETAYERITADRTRQQRVEELTEAVGAEAAVELVAREETDKLREAHEAAAERTERWRDAMEDLSAAIAENYGLMRRNADLTSQYEQAVDDMVAAFAENGLNLDLTTEAGRRNERAARETADAIVELMQRQFEETGSLHAAIQAGDLYVENLREQLRQAGWTNEQIDILIHTMELVPSEIATTINVHTAEAVAAIQALQRELAGVAANSHEVDVHAVVRPGQPTARAHGGPLGAGELALVGEKGPELFVSGTSGTVIPNDKLGAFDRHEITVNINAANIGASEVAREIAREVLWRIN